MKVKKLNEGGLSRIWQHINDDTTFAVIGSQDKDTKEIRDTELRMWVQDESRRYQTGYKWLEGTFTYETGDLGVEPSVIIYNIPKGDALYIAHILNQESIIWKDDKFFGFLTPDGKDVGRFSRDPKNMSFEDVEAFGSRLSHSKTHNKGKKFAFKLESLSPSNHNSIKNLGGYDIIKDVIDEWRF